MAPEGFSIRIATSAASFDLLASDWHRLYSATPGVTGFQSLGWLRKCWELLAPPSSTLHISVIEHERVPVAIFPAALDSAGVLALIGRESSNYGGPLFVPDKLATATEMWAEHLLASNDVRGIELTGVRGDSPFAEHVLRHGLPGWGRANVVTTNVCPEVDLAEGWDAVYGRHSKKTRSTWARKQKRLARLGPVDHETLFGPEDIVRELPPLFSMWEARFKGQRISGSFTKPRQSFHLAAGRAAAEGEAIQLDLLRVDGEPVAFYYGVRNPHWTTSYILAHDDHFGAFSPGLLLLLGILEKAATAGDERYDFSLGAAQYKRAFATHETAVYSLHWGRRSYLRATRSRLWVWARSVPWLQTLKVRGLRALVPGLAKTEPSAPSEAATTSSPVFVYELSANGAEPPSELRVAGYRDMKRLLPSPLVGAAIDRTFRGDRLHVCEGPDGVEIGTVWQLAQHRSSSVIGDRLDRMRSSRPVYCEPSPKHPATPEDMWRHLADMGDSLVVTNHPVAFAEAALVGRYPDQ